MDWFMSPLFLTVEATQPLSLIQAIVIGIVQGLTEFLPISSTAHVKIVPVILNWGDPGVTFTAIVQLGSIVAIVGYFWADIRQLLVGVGRAIAKKDYDDPDFRMALGIVIGTIPIVVLGLIVKFGLREGYESFARSSLVIGITSIGLAIFLGIAEVTGTRKRGYNAVGQWDGIGMGLAQALALIPGVSRSGSTMTAGLFMGLNRETAARFSLLMGIPAILISGLAELNELFEPQSTVGFTAAIAGVIASAISSYIAIYWLIRFLKDHTTWVFVFYRIGFGLAILWAIASGRMLNV
ncbi:undecaprenyl-diphosphate phosphatase [Oscillatoria sp. CS-180]|uniref:undecaprenyl-diphosphate phosphatase n=1 Tax=Oscillatoria sp. CS-180 TaxID=3021720 RepID=UPI00232F9A52|nr:undecaprenyl-diphosphate phosphatase [Oscillatoria sp. CS-180]